MKKLSVLIIVLVTVVIAWNCYPRDPIFIAVQPNALAEALQSNSNDPEKIVELIRTAIESKEVETAFQTLDKMRQEQPNNAVVHAAYAMANDAATFQIRTKSGVIRERTEKEQQEYESALKRAKQLNPNLWLIYVIEGFPLSYADPAPRFSEGLDLLRKAVKLAPESAYARYRYAVILHHAAANRKKWHGKSITFQQAVAEVEIAHKLDPQSSDIAYLLFFTYDIDLKDKENATRAKRAFLNTLPPNYNLSEFVKTRLARYSDQKPKP